MPVSTAELVGYVASALLILSFAMTNVVKLRVISLIGSLVYAIYGAMINAWPVIITNVLIVLIHLWNLYRQFTRKTGLGATPMAPDAPFLADFLASHLADIRKSQPEYEEHKADTSFVLMRDGMPAGALMGVRDGDNLHLTLDYVLPAYRDSKLGQWLYGEGSGTLRSLGIRTLSAAPSTEIHRSYLKGVGFAPEGDRLVRRLS